MQYNPRETIDNLFKCARDLEKESINIGQHFYFCDNMGNFERQVLTKIINTKHNSMNVCVGLDLVNIGNINTYGAFILSNGIHWIAIRRVLKDADFWIKIDSSHCYNFRSNKIMKSQDVITFLRKFEKKEGGIAIKKTITHRS